MNRVLIWDNTGESPKWCGTFLEKNDVKVIQTITASEDVPEILLKRDAWDWLLIFERNMRATFDTTIRALKLPIEKIIYALDVQSWLKSPKAIYNILSSSGRGTSHRYHTFNSCREVSDFVACTVEGISYLATAKDDVIMRIAFE